MIKNSIHKYKCKHPDYPKWNTIEEYKTDSNSSLFVKYGFTILIILFTAFFMFIFLLLCKWGII